MQSSRHPSANDDRVPGPLRPAPSVGSLLGQSRSRAEMEEADVDAQIAALQARKAAIREKEDKKKRENKVLVGGSPSPKKRPAQDFRIPNPKQARDSSAGRSFAVHSDAEDQMEGPSIGTRLKPPRFGDRELDAERAELLDGRSESTAANSFRASMAGARRSGSTNLALKPVPKSHSFAEKRPSIADGSAFASAKTRSDDRAKVEAKRLVKEKERDALARRYDDVLEAQESGGSRREEAVSLRNDDLTLAVRLPLGPIQHRASPSDPLFTHTEPNSGVRLSSRLISHPDLQDHLAERYILRGPGELYGAARRVRGKNEWEVPVTGDWVVFGVLAERSGIRYTNANGNRTATAVPEEGVAKEGADDEEEAFLQEGEEETAKGKKKTKVPVKETKESASRRYLIFKLLDLGSRSSSSDSAAASSSSYLNVFLFESSTETSDHLDSETAVRTKTYSGGSGGAYESLWKEQGGAVVAILNPRILPPRSNGPNSSDGDVLSITPESSASVLVVGRAKDLGSCRALRRDTGKECGGWVDLRTCGGGDAVCEWHVKRQVGKVRAGRSELFSGTGGMQTHTGTKFTAKSLKGGKKGQGAEYDPVNKTGLLPDRPVTTSINGSVVRVVGGSAQPTVYTTSTSHTRFSSRSKTKRATDDGRPKRFDEAMDQEKDKAARLKRQKAQEEREMAKMLSGDQKKGGSMGGKYLEQAKRVREAQKKKEEAKAAAKAKGKGKAAAKDVTFASTSVSKKRPATGDDSARNSADDESLQQASKRKRPFSAAVVRAIGFDPTLSHLNPAHRDPGETGTREAARELLSGPGERQVDLHFPEGEARRRSGVDPKRMGKKREAGGGRSKVEVEVPPSMKSSEEEEEESDDDLVIEPKPPTPRKRPAADEEELDDYGGGSSASSGKRRRVVLDGSDEEEDDDLP